MTGYVENPLSCEVLKEVRDELVDFQIDEYFLITVFFCLKLSKFYPGSIICFIELVVERFKKDIELLDYHIQSYNFQVPKQLLENLPSPKQEDIVFPFYFQIAENYVFEYDTETE